MQERDVRLFLPQDEEYLELRNNPQCTMSLFGLNLLFYFLIILSLMSKMKHTTFRSN